MRELQRAATTGPKTGCSSFVVVVVVVPFAPLICCNPNLLMLVTIFLPENAAPKNHGSVKHKPERAHNQVRELGSTIAMESPKNRMNAAATGARSLTRWQAKTTAAAYNCPIDLSSVALPWYTRSRCPHRGVGLRV